MNRCARPDYKHIIYDKTAAHVYTVTVLFQEWTILCAGLGILCSSGGKRGDTMFDAAELHDNMFCVYMYTTLVLI